jgi:hypothetical protein
MQNNVRFKFHSLVPRNLLASVWVKVQKFIRNMWQSAKLSGKSGAEKKPSHNQTTHKISIFSQPHRNGYYILKVLTSSETYIPRPLFVDRVEELRGEYKNFSHVYCASNNKYINGDHISSQMCRWKLMYFEVLLSIKFYRNFEEFWRLHLQHTPPALW